MPSTVTTIQLGANTVTPVDLSTPRDGRSRGIAVTHRVGTAPVNISIDGKAPERTESHRTAVLFPSARRIFLAFHDTEPGVRLLAEAPTTVDIEVVSLDLLTDTAVTAMVEGAA